MKKVLIVEDSDTLREVLATVLEQEGYQVESHATAEEALQAIQSNTYDCILADYRLPERSGLDLLKDTRELMAEVPYIIMTAYGSIEIAVEAMKLGANEFITKPFEPTVLCNTIREVIEHRRVIDRSIGKASRRPRRFMTKDDSLEKLLHQARKVAKVQTSVLISGESGTGKELIARYIHEQSTRKDKPFVAVNCAALPEALLESEFFGHEAGAFTGATQTRIGVFEIASEGTIFLDEIGDMPPKLQVRLLRALQENEIKRVGGNRTIPVNPRIIAATNRNLEQALDEQIIREDFYYRIAVVTLELLPLRRRKPDISFLADYFIDYFCSITGREKLVLSREALDLLEGYPWPGNARELENVIERAVILAQDKILPEHLGLEMNIDFGIISDATATLPEIASKASRKAEVELIQRTLGQTSGNRTKAAELLGVSYKTLLNKIKEYQIAVQP